MKLEQGEHLEAAAHDLVEVLGHLGGRGQVHVLQQAPEVLPIPLLRWSWPPAANVLSVLRCTAEFWCRLLRVIPVLPCGPLHCDSMRFTHCLCQARPPADLLMLAAGAAALQLRGCAVKGLPAALLWLPSALIGPGVHARHQQGSKSSPPAEPGGHQGTRLLLG